MHENSLLFREMNPGIIIKRIQHVVHADMSLVASINMNNNLLLENTKEKWTLASRTTTSQQTSRGYIYNR